MATTCSIDQLLLASIPNLPWPDGNYTKTLQAVVLNRDWKYDDTTHNVPNVLKGRMPTRLLVNGRLPLFRHEPGYLFYEGSETAMIMVIKGTMVVPVVLPTVILTKGAMFRSLAEQTVNQLPSLTSESTSAPEVTEEGRPFSRFVHSFWQTLAKNTQELRNLRMNLSAIDACFTGPRLMENRNAILNAVLPPVREVLKDGTFSLKDLLDLRHVSGDWPPVGKQCVYLRIYTHPEDRLDYTYSDSSQADINKNVGFYIGSSNNAQRRHREHEHATDNRSSQSYELQHYRIARKSQKQHRHMIPLMLFDPSTPKHVLMMAEQTLTLAFRSYQAVLYVPDETGGSTGLANSQQQAQFLSSVARPVMDEVAWPALKPRGCNMSSSLFEDQARVEILCIPMVPGDASIRTFTTYRVRKKFFTAPDYGGGQVFLNLYDVNTESKREVSFSLPTEVLEIQGPKPADSTAGYLVFEVMDDKKAHPQAWFGVPSIGPFENFDRASSFAVRYEWYDSGQQKWYSIPIARRIWGFSAMKEWIAQERTERVLETWRIAMDVVQAIEGIIYTEPLNDFKSQFRVGEVKKLQTDHLGQRYQWITRPMITMPAPRYATFNENFAQMYRQFNTQRTHVGPTEPIPRNADVLNRAPKDSWASVKCDSCLYIGSHVKCERDERITDAWVCKCCFIFHRPCSFTAISDALELWGNDPPYRPGASSLRLGLIPSGPHRHLSFHQTMTMEEIVTVKVVPQPLPEHLSESQDLHDEGGDALADD